MTTDNLEIIKQQGEEIIVLAARCGARNIRVLGSVVRGDSNELSAIKLVVTLNRGVTVMKMSALRRELEAIFGCKVDVVSHNGLRERIGDRDLAEAVPL
jgi:hypothetical protein